MGQSLDVLTTCDGTYGREAETRQRAAAQGSAPAGMARPAPYLDDPGVGCAALEDAAKQAVANANRGGARISDEVLLNHELLQHARQGNVKGVATALEKGAWTETRRPLVMKPQKPDVHSKGHERNDSPDVGMTALMFSAQYGSSDCVRRLLWAGANVNAVEEDGWTALHFGAKEGQIDVCTALLQGRADPEAINAEDKTPLQVAEEEDDDFAAKLRAALSKRATKP